MVESVVSVRGIFCLNQLEAIDMLKSYNYTVTSSIPDKRDCVAFTDDCVISKSVEGH